MVLPFPFAMRQLRPWRVLHSFPAKGYLVFKWIFSYPVLAKGLDIKLNIRKFQCQNMLDKSNINLAYGLKLVGIKIALKGHYQISYMCVIQHSLRFS